MTRIIPVYDYGFLVLKHKDGRSILYYRPNPKKQQDNIVPDILCEIPKKCYFEINKTNDLHEISIIDSI